MKEKRPRTTGLKFKCTLIEGSFEFFCVLEIATSSIGKIILAVLCSLIGFVIFISLAKKFIRRRSKNKYFHRVADRNS